MRVTKEIVDGPGGVIHWISIKEIEENPVENKKTKKTKVFKDDVSHGHIAFIDFKTPQLRNQAMEVCEAALKKMLGN